MRRLIIAGFVIVAGVAFSLNAQDSSDSSLLSVDDKALDSLFNSPSDSSSTAAPPADNSSSYTLSGELMSDLDKNASAPVSDPVTAPASEPVSTAVEPDAVVPDAVVTEAPVAGAEEEDLQSILGVEESVPAAAAVETEPVVEPAAEVAPVDSSDVPAASTADDGGAEVKSLLGTAKPRAEVVRPKAAPAAAAVVGNAAPVAPVRKSSAFDMTTEPLKMEASGAGAYDEYEEMVKSEARQIQAMQELALGEKALINKAYEVGLAHFLNAENGLSDRIENADGRRRANEGAMISQYYLAIDKMNKGELQGDQGALALAQRSFERDRRFKAAERLIERIQLRVEEQRIVESKASLKRRTSPDWKQKHAQTETWIQSAIQHMRVNEYDEAVTELNKVLAIDPANQSAIDLLMTVHEQRHKVKAVERQTTSKGMMADVTSAWNPRDYNLSIPPNTDISAGPTTKIVGPTDEERLTQKMQTIQIPEVVFRDANVHDVVEFLVQASRDGDPDPQKLGINIILNLGEQQVNGISFSARYVSLLGAIKILTEVADLKYRMEENAVMIVSKDDPGGKIIPRFYPIDPAVIRRLSSPAEAESAAEGEDGGGGGFLGTGSASLSSEPTDLKEYFRSLGVDFPRSSSISYSSSIGKLIVANTAENHAALEKVLKELNVIPPQVEIETRFVDIAKTDLKEIGLEWLLTDNWEVLEKKGAAGAPLGSRPRIQVAENESSKGFTKGLRFTEQGQAGSLMAVQSVLTNPEMTWLLHAIEQSGHGDLLSAPKITTQPGLQAQVKVATEYIYPTEYRVENGGASVGTAGVLVQVPVVIPDVFETREVGVILTVMPEVSPDNRIITLTLAPEVVTEPYWYDYGYKLSDGTQVPMKMPFFNSRNAETTIKVYDGATVVLGGMISEAVTTKDDKVPVLGSIPILGSLFSSNSKKNEKRNLLIFVTARLVDPSGKPIKGTAREGQAELQAANTP